MPTIDNEIFERGVCMDSKVNKERKLLCKLKEMSLDRFTHDDFFDAQDGRIYNKNFYDGCPLLFVLWQDEYTPILVYNSLPKENAPPEEFDNWRSIWGCFYYNRKHHPMATPYSRRWDDLIIPRLKDYMWIMSPY